LGIIELPNREARKKKLEEVRRISKYAMHPQMDEMYHDIFRGEFWEMFEHSIDRIEEREAVRKNKKQKIK